MSTNNFYKDDLNKIHNIVQSSMLVYPKEIIIAILRDYFSKSTYYHFDKDQFGFANTTDHTDLEPGADIPSPTNPGPNLSTRLFIGENYRYDGIYYPAILIKTGGGKYVPISANREQESVKTETVLFEDGYGNQSFISRPVSFITAGIWEGQINIDVMTRSLRSRDDLVELIGMCFTDIYFNTLYDVGVIVKPISYSAPSEADDRNDKLFKQSLTLDVRTEWRREVPIKNIIDAILFTVNFANLQSPNPVDASNLTINTSISLIENLIENKYG